MKKLLFLLPVLLLSCTKEVSTSDLTAENDSLMATDATAVDQISDSVANGKIILNEESNLAQNNATFRAVEGNKIIKTINGEMIPLIISDELTSKNQQFVLKIKNFKRKEIKGKIIPENPKMNIRFNQIRLSNGELDGPFGLDLNYQVEKEGEIWLMIEKSNMASGETTGKFTVELN